MMTSWGPEELVPILVPVASFGATIAIVAIVLYFRYRTLRLKQDLLEAFLAKGEAIPPALLSLPKAAASRNGDLRRGLVLLGGGGGLSVALLFAHQPDAAGFGLIPALIGVAFLIVWKVEAGAGSEQASG
jgi:hypothetical protein